MRQTRMCREGPSLIQSQTPSTKNSGVNCSEVSSRLLSGFQPLDNPNISSHLFIPTSYAHQPVSGLQAQNDAADPLLHFVACLLGRPHPL